MLHKYESKHLYDLIPKQIPNHIWKGDWGKKCMEANNTLWSFFYSLSPNMLAYLEEMKGYILGMKFKVQKTSKFNNICWYYS